MLNVSKSVESMATNLMIAGAANRICIPTIEKQYGGALRFTAHAHIYSQVEHLGTVDYADPRFWKKVEDRAKEIDGRIREKVHGSHQDMVPSLASRPETNGPYAWIPKIVMTWQVGGQVQAEIDKSHPLVYLGGQGFCIVGGLLRAVDPDRLWISALWPAVYRTAGPRQTL
jgi:hypothetical protein